MKNCEDMNLYTLSWDPSHIIALTILFLWDLGSKLSTDERVFFYNVLSVLQSVSITSKKKNNTIRSDKSTGNHSKQGTK